MTRRKKSRKPGVGSIGIKKDTTKNEIVREKKPKKLKGKRPGTRQLEAQPKQNNQSTSTAKKDPRVGSKKPIELGAIAAKVEKKKVVKTKNTSPIAAIKVVETDHSLMEELKAIENNPELQLILEKQDSGELLSEQEIDLFNSLMDRHEELTEKLGISDEESTDEMSESASDEDLWDKFDTSDFNDFDED